MRTGFSPTPASTRLVSRARWPVALARRSSGRQSRLPPTRPSNPRVVVVAPTTAAPNEFPTMEAFPMVPGTPSTAVELRAARPEDLPGIEQLLTKAELPLAGVAESLPGFVVAESDGAIVGTAARELCSDN